jgi:hypothetical protein
MGRAARLILAATLALLGFTERGSAWQSARCAFCFYPAYFQPSNPPHLWVFPPDGPKAPVALPDGLPRDLRGVEFSDDGEALYLQTINSLDRAAGIYKVQFRPPRQGLVPGSVGVGELWCLAVSRATGVITLSGMSWALNRSGVFRIDPRTATSRAAPSGSPSACGGSGGVMSPDGGRAVVPDGGQFGLEVMKTGAIRLIKGAGTGAQSSWSPDSRWIAVVLDGSATLVDASDVTRRRRLGSTGHGPLIWSPDSKYLLLRKSGFSCGFGNEGESLEVVDVETGKRREIKSSHCGISAGTLGWLDRSLAQ